MNSQLFDKNKMEADAYRQNEFLNGVLGIVSFTLAFTCMLSPNPQKSAYVGLIIIIPLIIRASKLVPETITVLRQLKKEHPDDVEVKNLLKYLEDKYLGVMSMFKNNLVYLFGLTLYFIVMLFPEFSKWVTLA